MKPRSTVLLLMFIVVGCFGAMTAPAGMIAFFDSTGCSGDWSEVSFAWNRIPIATTNGVKAGITFGGGEPLGIQEVRTHIHVVSETSVVTGETVKSYGDGIVGAKKPFETYIQDSSPSALGYKFLYLRPCQLTDDRNNMYIPEGTVAYFAPPVSTCPTDWEPYDSLNGRHIVPAFDFVGTTDAEAWIDGDSTHSHAMSCPVINTGPASEALGLNWLPGFDIDTDFVPAGGYTPSCSSNNVASGLPFAYMLGCIFRPLLAPTLWPDGNVPPPANSMMFHESACDTELQTDATDYQGHIIVPSEHASTAFGGTPVDGTPMSHTHTVPPRDLPGAGLCDAPGECDEASFCGMTCDWVAAGAQNVQFTSTSESSIPYLGLPLCIRKNECTQDSDCTPEGPCQQIMCDHNLCRRTPHPDTTPCRTSSGPCDLEEKCDGSSSACPSDAKSSASCRPVTGPCDATEYCDGTSNDCPADAKEPLGTTCRASVGACDVAETCDGASDDCPTDGKAPTDVECRASAGPCDIPEFCDGTSADCPADAKEPLGTTCRASVGDCDIAEVCDGGRNTCPIDEKRSANLECRPAAGPCDIPEFCDGTSDECPADAKEPLGTTCRASVGDCDIAEVCDGGRNTCPIDEKRSANLECRPAAGPCDIPEFCDGTSDECPADAKEPLGTTCRASVGDCDIAEVCDGGRNTCPIDEKRSANLECRPAAGPCDIPEFCDGTSDECPADQLRSGPSCTETISKSVSRLSITMSASLRPSVTDSATVLPTTSSSVGIPITNSLSIALPITNSGTPAVMEGAASRSITQLETQSASVHVLEDPPPTPPTATQSKSIALPEPTKPPVISPAVKTAASSIATAGVMGAPANAVQANRLAMTMSLGDCDRDFEPLGWYQNVLALEIALPGEEQVRYYLGAVVGNNILLIGLAAVMVILAGGWYVIERRKNPKFTMLDAISDVRFPSLLVIPYLFVLEPIVESGVVVFMYGGVWGSIIVIVCLLLSVGAVGALTFFFMRARGKPGRFPARFNLDADAGFFDEGSWQPLADPDENPTQHAEQKKFLHRCSFFFSEYHDAARWFIVVECVVTVITAVLQGTKKGELECKLSVSFVAIAFAAYFCSLLYFKPQGSRFGLWFCGIIAAVQLVCAVLSLIYVFNLDEALMSVVEYLATGAMFAMTAKTVFDLFQSIRGVLAKRFGKRTAKDEVAAEDEEMAQVLLGVEENGGQQYGYAQQCPVAETTQEQSDIYISEEMLHLLFDPPPKDGSASPRAVPDPIDDRWLRPRMKRKKSNLGRKRVPSTPQEDEEMRVFLQRLGLARYYYLPFAKLRLSLRDLEGLTNDDLVVLGVRNCDDLEAIRNELDNPSPVPTAQTAAANRAVRATPNMPRELLFAKPLGPSPRPLRPIVPRRRDPSPTAVPILQYPSFSLTYYHEDDDPHHDGSPAEPPNPSPMKTQESPSPLMHGDDHNCSGALKAYAARNMRASGR